MKIKILVTTTDNLETAEAISKNLIDNNLSACVQIIPEVKSFNHWKGKIETSKEFSIQIKTKPESVQACKEIILNYHNYDIPEIIAKEADILYDDYESWFKSVTES